MFLHAQRDDCAALNNILKVYEAASGQKINFNKSCITYNLDVDEGLWDEIKEC